MIRADGKLICNMFKPEDNEQLRLVTSFNWLELSLLDGIEEEVGNIFRGSLFVDEARCDAICQALRGRIEHLQEIIYIREPHIHLSKKILI